MAENSENNSKNIRKFDKGEYLFQQNDTTQELYIVKKGSVRIFKIVNNTEIVLDTVGPGAVIGEIALIDRCVRSASAIAIEDTEVIAITATEFDSVFTKMPEWFKKIALILVQRLREVDSKINKSSDCDHTDHVAAIMSLLFATNQCIVTDEGYEISSKLLEDEIMDLFCLQPSETITILENLQKQGIIRIGHSKVTILQKDAIEKKTLKILHS
jgi:CRP/FNR family transcriptional regulator